MGLLNFIFNLGGSREGWEGFNDEEEAPPSSHRYHAPAVCACNNCGRTFHETWLHCYCPARCGGRVYARS